MPARRRCARNLSGRRWASGAGISPAFLAHLRRAAEFCGTNPGVPRMPRSTPGYPLPPLRGGLLPRNIKQARNSVQFVRVCPGPSGFSKRPVFKYAWHPLLSDWIMFKALSQRVERTFYVNPVLFRHPAPNRSSREPLIIPCNSDYTLVFYKRVDTSKISRFFNATLLLLLFHSGRFQPRV